MQVGYLPESSVTMAGNSVCIRHVFANKAITTLVGGRGPSPSPMLSWQNDSQPLVALAPTGLVQLDPLPLKTISARGLCLVRMEFLRAAGSIDVCVVTSPCAAFFGFPPSLAAGWR